MEHLNLTLQKRNIIKCLRLDHLNLTYAEKLNIIKCFRLDHLNLTYAET